MMIEASDRLSRDQKGIFYKRLRFAGVKITLSRLRRSAAATW
jgi:hypothetical protein